MYNHSSLLFDLCSSVSETHQQALFSSDLQKNPASGEQYDIQFVHQKLYPILFQYVDRFIRDEETSDTLIADLFFEMVKNDELNGDLKHVLVIGLQNARKTCINYATESSVFFEFVAEDFNETTPLNLLLLNSMSLQEREVAFLKHGLGLHLSEIDKIINFLYPHINQMGTETDGEILIK